jgi:hypothetical protein
MADVSKRTRLQRSAGTVMPWDLARSRLHGPDEAASAADIAAVDRGDGRRVFCSFRGLYGRYPRNFRGYLLDLTRDGPVLRPLVALGFLWKRLRITDPLISARVRPFESEGEARKLLATGQYAPGGSLEWAGTVVISCETAAGILEFAVKRPDVPLILRYFNKRAQPQGASSN